MGQDVSNPADNRQQKARGTYRILIIILILLALIASSFLIGLPQQLGLRLFGAGIGTSGSQTDGLVYFDLPEASVTIVEPNSYTVVNIFITLELERQDQVLAANTFVPHYLDATYLLLSGLQREQLQGGAALSYLRQELLFRYKKISPDVEIRQVLFSSLNIQ